MGGFSDGLAAWAEFEHERYRDERVARKTAAEMREVFIEAGLIAEPAAPVRLSTFVDPRTVKSREKVAQDAERSALAQQFDRENRRRRLLQRLGLAVRDEQVEAQIAEQQARAFDEITMRYATDPAVSQMVVDARARERARQAQLKADRQQQVQSGQARRHQARNAPEREQAASRAQEAALRAQEQAARAAREAAMARAAKAFATPRKPVPTVMDEPDPGDAGLEL